VLTAARTSFQSSAQVDRDVRATLTEDGGAAAGTLYTLDESLLRELRPDVILTQDLCRVCSIDLASVRSIAASLRPPPTVVSLNATTVEGVLDDMLNVGEAVGLTSQAERTVVSLRERMARTTDYVSAFEDGPSVAFLEWTDPLFIGGHWVPQLIERAGGRHPLNPTVPVEGSGAAAGPIGATLRAAGRSVTVPPEVLVASRPEVVIICPCGLPLAQALAEAGKLATRPWWPELPAARTSRIAVVDGNQMFSRPGPRLADALEFLVGYLGRRENLIPEGFPWQPLGASAGIPVLPPLGSTQ
jgi:ABC-type Fe3+-hydroxamate transport system substrate-binding protein